ncbi:MAG: pentapeptide repeat-containing protein [Kiloniellales bacterium]|nr:pentapeptide repeat-containing protein [Kiloniellales bacterium]
MAYEWVPTTLDKKRFMRGHRRPSRLGFIVALGRIITSALDGIAAALERLHLIRILGTVALVVGGPAFLIELLDRTEERTVRAWQLVTTPAPGNSGKREALEYLNSAPWYWPLKRRITLGGVDLSEDLHGGRVELAHIDLPNARLAAANLSGAVLRYSDLNQSLLMSANLKTADLHEASLDGAVLSNANLRGARLTLALLTNADLSSANLTNAHLSHADFNGAYFRGTNLSGATFNRPVALVHTSPTQEQLSLAWAWSDNPPSGLPIGFSPQLCSPPTPRPENEDWRAVKPDNC